MFSECLYVCRRHLKQSHIYLWPFITSCDHFKKKVTCFFYFQRAELPSNLEKYMACVLELFLVPLLFNNTQRLVRLEDWIHWCEGMWYKSVTGSQSWVSLCCQSCRWIKCTPFQLVFAITIQLTRKIRICPCCLLPQTAGDFFPAGWIPVESSWPVCLVNQTVAEKWKKKTCRPDQCTLCGWRMTSATAYAVAPRDVVSLLIKYKRTRLLLTYTVQPEMSH